VAKDKRYGKYSASEWRKNLTKLEATLGQKKASEKLGVSPRTYRNWKSGKTQPKPNQAKKANRIYGQNKKNLTYSDLKKTVKKSKQRSKQRKKQIRQNPKLMATNEFIKQFDEAFIRDGIKQDMPMFIATYDGNAGQFVSMPQEHYGKPARDKQSVTILGLYRVNYESASDGTLGDTDLIESQIRILDGFTKAWDLEQTLEYLEKKFYATNKWDGSRKLEPVRFIGFKRE